jgi:hypothetical protein
MSYSRQLAVTGMVRIRRAISVACVCGLWIAVAGASGGQPAAPTGTVEVAIDFARGKWDTNRWTAMRMVNQEKAVPMTQFDDSIGTTTNTFSEADYNKERDNALLVYDTGLPEGQVEVTFSLDKKSSPGICISPRIKGGVVDGGIGVFVATYAVVAWYEYTEGDQVRYIHLGQLARWTDPAKKHVLRYRFAPKGRDLAIQLDGSDVMVFQFVGNPQLSHIPQELNSLVALWGCHGACTFHAMTVRGPGTLPFLATAP